MVSDWTPSQPQAAKNWIVDVAKLISTDAPDACHEVVTTCVAMTLGPIFQTQPKTTGKLSARSINYAFCQLRTL